MDNSKEKLYKSLDTLADNLTKFMELVITYPHIRSLLSKKEDIKISEVEYRDKVEYYVGILSHTTKIIGETNWLDYLDILQTESASQYEFTSNPVNKIRRN